MKNKRLKGKDLAPLAKASKKQALVCIHIDYDRIGVTSYGTNRRVTEGARKLGEILKAKTHDVLGGNLDDYWMRFLKALGDENGK